MDNEHKSVKNNTKKSKLVFAIQEAERKRIARDLHDTSLQDLTHLVHQLELMGLYMEKDPIKANLELISIKKSLKRTIDDIRNIIFDLRPMTIDDLGLKESFEVFFQGINENTDFHCIVDIDSIVGEGSYVLNIYRIVVECVMNAVKHSEGDEIVFRCKTDGYSIYIWIEDNGKGFDYKNYLCNNNHYGLSIIRERVGILDGDLEINSNIGQGTKIFISIPIQ